MKKAQKIEAMLQEWGQTGYDPHYAGYFSLFNQQQFYEAHDVLEHLWLEVRTGKDGDFFKGLIQLAGAFVHIQKSRPRPAKALLDLAWKNIARYPDIHWNLQKTEVAFIVSEWSAFLTAQGVQCLDQLEKTPPTLWPKDETFTGPTQS